LRLRILYHHVDLNLKEFSILGVTKAELAEVMYQHLVLMIERYFADRQKFEEMRLKGKVKIESRLEKLAKTQSIIQILKKYFMATIKIFLTRIVTVELDNLLLEFDRRDENELVQKEKGDMETYNMYFNKPDRKQWVKFDAQTVAMNIVHGTVNQ
jgi:hypothetical protein